MNDDPHKKPALKCLHMKGLWSWIRVVSTLESSSTVTNNNSCKWCICTGSKDSYEEMDGQSLPHQNKEWKALAPPWPCWAGTEVFSALDNQVMWPSAINTQLLSSSALALYQSFQSRHQCMGLPQIRRFRWMDIVISLSLLYRTQAQLIQYVLI